MTKSNPPIDKIEPSGALYRGDISKGTATARKKGGTTETGTETGSKYIGKIKASLIVVILFCVATIFYGRQNLEYYSNYATITSTTTDATITVTPTTSAAVTDVTTAVTVRWPASLVNDKTLTWDPIMYRPWLDRNISPGKRPPAMLMLSTIGYNQQNQTKALQIARSIRDTELLNGVINHPWFHPTAWDIIRNEDRSFNSSHDESFNPSNSTRYYVFFDLPGCWEGNYPNYGVSLQQNSDVRWNRTNMTGEDKGIKMFLGKDKYINLFKERVFREGRNTKAIVYNCRGTPDSDSATDSAESNLPVSIAFLSAVLKNVNPTKDQGLPPPMPKPIHLTEEEEKDIETCAAEDKRRFHALYIGNKRGGHNQAFNKLLSGGTARGNYFPFHDNNRTIFLRNHHKNEYNESSVGNFTYEDVLRRTSFGIAPRGDNKFTYRFSEVLSAGAIPVVHADNWVWPFRPELIDWNECAVILPEIDSGKVAMAVLDGMGRAEKCRRRQRCYEIYKRYIETTRGTVAGLIDGLELVAQGKHAPMGGVQCGEVDPRCNNERR